MDEIKSQLKDFRERKAQERQKNNEHCSKTVSAGALASSTNASTSNDNRCQSNGGSQEENGEPHEVDKPFDQKLQTFLLMTFVWLIAYMVALKLEFGIVYCIATGFFVLWKSLGRRRRAADELSAYSVFNPNCERLLGQTTAEQFENEIRHRQV